jgi:tetratricopeptide (TPR) repeat protein
VAAARHAWKLGKHHHAVALFDEAVRREPHNVRAYYEAARAHAESGDVVGFAKLAEQLRQVAPRRPGVHHLAGELYEWLSLPKQAARCFEKACRLAGAQSESLVALAAQWERIHRLDAALELVDRALANDPNLPQGLVLRARLARRRGDNGTAEAILRRLIQQLPRDSIFRLRALGDLAALLDEQGDFGGAVEAIGACKAEQLAVDATEWAASEHVLGRFRQAVESIRREDFARWRADGRYFAAHRIALLTGFPRSGTTLLEQALSAHREIISAEERDFVSRHFFPAIHGSLSPHAPVQEVLDRVDAKRLQAERARYRQTMEFFSGEAIGDRLLIDKNPAYNPVLPIMLRLFPELRIVVALRDPRDVVLSCYLRYLPLNPVSVRFLTIERTAERYAFDMTAWLRFRETIPAPWCEVRYEDVVADLEGQARRALDVLGVEWDEAVLKYRVRPQQSPVMSPTYESVAKPIYTTAIGRWRNYESFLAPVLPLLDPFVKAFGYN